MKNSTILLLNICFLSSSAFAHQQEGLQTQPVLASLQDLQQINAPISAQDPLTGVGFSYLTPEMQIRLQNQSHSKGKCGGYEVLPAKEVQSLNSVTGELNLLRQQYLKDQSFLKGPVQYKNITAKSSVAEAISLVQGNNLHETVSWLSAFPSRDERSSQKNAHIEEMKTKVETLLKNYSGASTTELIDHSGTTQKSLKVTLRGSVRPDEIVILGGHHDSVASSWGGGSGQAPGADDNASGSANLLEIVRILTELPPSERTIEVMWYAAEESGLIGSAEIAKAYKAENKNVIAALQLDMTAFPGSGEMTIANITDFTSPWLHNLLKQLNETYLIGLTIVDDECGYGCSDHASWYRQGFSTAVPFESNKGKMNPNIHSKKDVLSPELSFKHSAAITQLSLAFALELANSNLKGP